jgi:hypothetical protein
VTSARAIEEKHQSILVSANTLYLTVESLLVEITQLLIQERVDTEQEIPTTCVASHIVIQKIVTSVNILQLKGEILVSEEIETLLNLRIQRRGNVVLVRVLVIRVQIWNLIDVGGIYSQERTKETPFVVKFLSERGTRGMRDNSHSDRMC